MKELTVLAVVLSVIIILGCIEGPKPTVTTTVPKLTGPEPGRATTTTMKEEIQSFREAVSTSDTSKCGEITDQRLKDICLRDIAVRVNDVGLCARVETSSLRDTCYYRIAVNTNDKDLCGMITRDYIKDTCNERV